MKLEMYILEGESTVASTSICFVCNLCLMILVLWQQLAPDYLVRDGQHCLQLQIEGVGLHFGVCIYHSSLVLKCLCIDAYIIQGYHLLEPAKQMLVRISFQPGVKLKLKNTSSLVPSQTGRLMHAQAIKSNSMLLQSTIKLCVGWYLN